MTNHLVDFKNPQPNKTKIFVHAKRGTRYEILDTTILQTQTPLEDGATLCIYRDLDSQKIWARAHDEFFDGRFEEKDNPNTEESAEEKIKRLESENENYKSELKKLYKLYKISTT